MSEDKSGLENDMVGHLHQQLSRANAKIAVLEGKLERAVKALEQWGGVFKGAPHCGCGVDEPGDICMIHEQVEEALADLRLALEKEKK